ncbi:MAG: FRG domain-containing protein [Bryobacterales bacterium]|nr:FRG domain-containing protein [Bryobacterales bacterium]
MPEGTEIVTSTAGSLMEAFEAAMAWMGPEFGNQHYWFRGVTNRSFGLTPGAYWRQEYDELENLIYLVQEGRSYCQVGELDDWRTYYLAQHHGIPTRLLDWTESFTSALFFALDGWDGETTPCVWIVRPDLLNEQSISWRGVITPEQNKELNIWLPRSIAQGRKRIQSEGYWYDNGLPVAIYPRRENARVIAQQGTFTVHGTEREGLEEWVLSFENPNEVLHRVDLEGIDGTAVMGQLRALGVKRHFIYPDVDNYVKHLRQVFGW